MSEILQTEGTTVTGRRERFDRRTSSRAHLSPEQAYERWAATYDSTPNPLLALEERCLLPRLPAMQGKVVVDFACGTGRWLEKLITLGAANGVGLDLSPAMLTVAMNKPTMAHRLARADCCRLPLKAELFDFGICSFALSHFQSIGAIAHQFSMVLKTGSDLVLSDIHPQACSYGWRTAFRDGATVIEIQTAHPSITDILTRFGSCGFACREFLSEQLGDPEKPLFALASKEDLFLSAREQPAIFIARFQKTSKGRFTDS